MPATMVIGVAAVLAAIAVGWLMVHRAGSDHRTYPPVLSPLVGAAIAVRVIGGRLGAALLIALAGSGFIMWFMWGVGEVVQALEPVVDHPAFSWVEENRVGGAWDKIWLTLTNIGSLQVTQTLTVAASIGLAALWRHRRWWVPLVVLPLAYTMEKVLQDVLNGMVDRGHPPTTLGSFPSGGCARVIVVYGLIAFFTLRWRGASAKGWQMGLGVVLLLATVQAYARTYNLEHWITDVFGGLLFGILLLATMVAISAALDVEPSELG